MRYGLRSLLLVLAMLPPLLAGGWFVAAHLTEKRQLAEERRKLEDELRSAALIRRLNRLSGNGIFTSDDGSTYRILPDGTTQTLSGPGSAPPVP